jgi:hypothetical protein
MQTRKLALQKLQRLIAKQLLAPPTAEEVAHEQH